MKKILSLAFSIFLFLGLAAQNGTLSGKVLDETTGETLIGASVVISSLNKSTTVDLDGNYTLQVPAGTYEVKCIYISYNTQVLTDVVVKAGAITQQDVLMSVQSLEIEGAVITAKANSESNAAIFIEQKNASVLFDGISSDAIRKTPDRNTADVLKRVSGATIQDNSFVVIRGLPERYNAAFLNGSPLPSSEPDRKAFSFDIFPAALLNDLKIIKTAMPSLSGEFGGGIIQIRTKDIPENNYYSISLGTSFNTITSFKPFMRSKGGSIDFLGFDDGTRSLPDAFPGNEAFNDLQTPILQKDELVTLAKSMKNNFPVSSFTAFPSMNFQFSMGHAVDLKRRNVPDSSLKSNWKFGSVFAVTYNYNLTFRQNLRSDFNDVEQTVSYQDDQYSTNVNWGGLWNIAFVHSNKKGASNRISLKNLYNVNSNDQMIYRTGAELDNQFEVKGYNMLYTQNNLFSTQLNGEHVLAKSKIRFDWGGGFSRLDRILPDYRIVEYRRNLGDSTASFMVPFTNSVQPNKAGRFFSVQQDHIFSGNFDFTAPVKIGSTRHEIKAGGYFQYKDRSFEGRQFGYTRYKSTGSQVNYISTWAVDSIFDERVFGPEGLMIREVTKKSDSYIFQNSLAAAYIQLENTFFESRLRLIWGVRMESYRQYLETYKIGNDLDLFTLDTTVTDFLPSVNIIGGINKKMNIRASYSQTVARPEARELAPFSFYDYSIFALVQGNDKIQRTKINNFDLRYEFYPEGGQLLSVTVFGKLFKNPIEKILVPSQSSGRKLSYINVPSAYAIGAELEYRFTIGSFMESTQSQFLKNFQFIGNIAVIHSEVNLDSVMGVNERRPLQGQSPFIVNVGFQYDNVDLGLSISTFLNITGRRIFSVGDITYASIYEKSRPVWDFQITKTFLNRNLELKLNLKDLIAPDYVNYQDKNRNGKYDKGVDNDILVGKVGQQVSFSVGYKF